LQNNNINSTNNKNENKIDNELVLNDIQNNPNEVEKDNLQLRNILIISAIGVAILLCLIILISESKKIKKEETYNGGWKN